MTVAPRAALLDNIYNISLLQHWGGGGGYSHATKSAHKRRRFRAPRPGCSRTVSAMFSPRCANGGGCGGGGYKRRPSGSRPPPFGQSLMPWQQHHRQAGTAVQTCSFAFTSNHLATHLLDQCASVPCIRDSVFKLSQPALEVRLKSCSTACAPPDWNGQSTIAPAGPLLPHTPLHLWARCCHAHHCACGAIAATHTGEFIGKQLWCVEACVSAQ